MTTSYDRTTRSHRTLLVGLAVILALIVACGGGGGGGGVAVRTVAQRIDDAAAAIAKSIGTSSSTVKTTFRTSLNPATDVSLALSLERIQAARSEWTKKAWALAEQTLEIAQKEEVKFVSKLVCDGLEAVEKGEKVSEITLRVRAMLHDPNASKATIDRIVKAASTTIQAQSQLGIDYIVWVRATTCLIDKLSG